MSSSCCCGSLFSDYYYFDYFFVAITHRLLRECCVDLKQVRLLLNDEEYADYIYKREKRWPGYMSLVRSQLVAMKNTLHDNFDQFDVEAVIGHMMALLRDFLELYSLFRSVNKKVDEYNRRKNLSQSVHTPGVSTSPL
jgi:hypothetical protein